MGQFYLYRHIRPDLNVPFYVGIGKKYRVPYTPAKDESEFRRAFDSKARRSDMWRRVFEKNKNRIEVEILLESDDYNEIKEKEIEFIKLHGRRDLGLGTLINFTDGGQGLLGHIPSKETREKRSISSRGKKMSEETKMKISQQNLGKKRTDEMKMNFSLQRKSNPKYIEVIKKLAILNKGSKKTKEFGEKIRASKIGKPRSEETKLKLSETRKALNLKWSDECRVKNCLKIEQYDISGNLLNTFIGRLEAGKAIGVSTGSIQNALNTNKPYKGFIWLSV